MSKPKPFDVIFIYYGYPPTTHKMTEAHAEYQRLGGNKSLKDFSEKVKEPSGLVLSSGGQYDDITIFAVQKSEKANDAFDGISQMEEL